MNCAVLSGGGGIFWLLGKERFMANRDDGGSSWVIILLPAIPIILGVSWYVVRRYKKKIEKQMEEFRRKGDELWRISTVVNKKLREDYECLLKEFKALLEKISQDGWVDKDGKEKYRILEARVNNFPFHQNEGV
jgi:hypothetical protein